MTGIHNDDAALDYLSHRIRMEQDFYEEPMPSTFPQLRDTLPQLEEAASRGDLAPAYLAATKDRIDIREGRSQKKSSAPMPTARRTKIIACTAIRMASSCRTARWKR